MLATPLETATLPPGIRSRFVRGVNGLEIHILEAGYAPAGRPLVLLLHGFPEIAYLDDGHGRHGSHEEGGRRRQDL